jgi:hypothetical protein
MAIPITAKGTVILFLVTWWALANHTPLDDYAFGAAILLMTIACLAIRMAGQAVARLGSTGQFLIVQVAIWFGLFLWFIPAHPLSKILVLWGIGIPLIMLGSIARVVYQRFRHLRSRLDRMPQAAVLLLFTVAPLISWAKGPGFWPGIGVAFLLATLPAIPLYYGWQLAAGISDER